MAEGGQAPAMAEGDGRSQQDWRVEVSYSKLKDKVEKEWYPKYKERSYFVPPVYMNNTAYEKGVYAGENIYFPQTPVPLKPEGAAKGTFVMKEYAVCDAAQSKMVGFFHEIAESDNKVMFVITNMDYGDYLNTPTYTRDLDVLGWTSANRIQRKIGKQKKEKRKKRQDGDKNEEEEDKNEEEEDKGDFDVIIIHKDYGILIGETKPNKKNPFKELEKAIKQLQKAELQLTLRALSDMPVQMMPRIKKTVLFPDLPEADLRELLEDNEQLSKDLCLCLGLDTTADPVPHCVTANTLQDPVKWWKTRMTSDGLDPAMNDDLYLSLITRFAGPATTITVATTTLPRLRVDTGTKVKAQETRSDAQGVVETGLRFTQLVLSSEQRTILHESEKLVFLTGPPGCGKSIVLYLKALCWLQQGKHVQLVSTWKNSLAMTYYIFNQLKMKVPEAEDRLHLHKLELRDGADDVDAQNAVKTLKEVQASRGGELFIIADETHRGLGLVIHELQKDGDVQAWGANIFERYSPHNMTKKVFSIPLRTPPLITEEIKGSSLMTTGEVGAYAADWPFPSPTDGRYTKTMFHIGDEPHCPSDCVKCGKDLGDWLHKDLQIRTTNSGRGEGEDPQNNYCSNVVIFSTGFDKPLTMKSGLVRGLKGAGVPVTEVKLGNEDDAEALASEEHTSDAVLTHHDPVSGHKKSVEVQVQKYSACAMFIKQREVEGQAELPSTPPTDGRHVKTLSKTDDDPHCPSDCVRCGTDLAEWLRDDLQIHPTKPGVKRGPLRYSDVLIVSTSSKPLSMESAFVQGLKGAGVPVKVVKLGDEGDAEALAKKAGDEVFVTDYLTISGLERSVVVVVQEYPAGKVDEDFGRMYVLSRCVSQLAWIKCTAQEDQSDSIIDDQINEMNKPSQQEILEKRLAHLEKQNENFEERVAQLEEQSKNLEERVAKHHAFLCTGFLVLCSMLVYLYTYKI